MSNDFLRRIKGLTNRQKPLLREIQARWNSNIPTKARSSIVMRTLCQAVDDLGVPQESELRVHLRNNDFLAFMDTAKAEADPARHGSARSFIVSAVLANLFSKVACDFPNVDPEATARERFREAEMLCRNTNKRFVHYRKSDFTSRPLVRRLRVHEIFHLARRKIEKWLSDYEPEDLLTRVRHGPGGTGGTDSALKRPFTTPYYKFATSEQGVTKGAYFLYLRSIAQCDAWLRALAIEHQAPNDPWPDLASMSFEQRIRLADECTVIAAGNQVGFVPKNFKTHRATASGPQGNVMCQLGLGGIFRDALKKAGCDLDSQVRNQDLAYAGSVEDGQYCPSTIDLRMASDCLSIELVRELFEPKWFDVMDALREQRGRLDDDEFEWAKFSAMGNGFTFELESMIFYALAQSVQDLLGVTEWYSDTFGPYYKYGQLAVYGDDIIVPYAVAQPLISVLRFCGFQTNLDKTFVDGKFRESCGRDFFQGEDVRTAYFKGDLSQSKQLVKLLNVLRYNEIMHNLDLTGAYAFVEEVLRASHPILCTHLRNTKATLGDEHIWCESDSVHCSKLVIWDADTQAWLMPTMKRKLILRQGNERWRYVQFLYSATANRLPNPEDEQRSSGALVNHFAEHLARGGSAGDVILAAREDDGVISWVSVCEDLTPMDLSFVDILAGQTREGRRRELVIHGYRYNTNNLVTNTRRGR